MNVLSLFDGISCGQVALQKAGIPYKKYIASEIDQRAIKVTQKNFPKTIQFGDVRFIKPYHFLEPIDLLIGGSPCQDLSVAGNMKGLEGVKSRLFYEYLRLLKGLKPKYFFLENVRMKKVWQDTITELLGVEPIYFDSALTSAQTRKRLYWTNIVSKEDFVYPKDRGILLEHVLEDFGETFYSVNNKFKHTIKANTIDANYFKGIGCNQTRTCVKIGDNGNKFESASRIYSPFGKSPYIHTQGGGGQEIKVANVITHSSQPRNGKGQGGKGHLSKEDGKAYCIDTSCSTMVEYADTYRKLTPLEVERCFNLPDNYTKGLSDSGRYHACGNGWEIDTIVEFFKHLPNHPAPHPMDLPEDSQ